MSRFSLLALAELPEILRHRVDVARRDLIGRSAADLVAVGLFGLFAELQLQRFEVRQNLAAP